MQNPRIHFEAASSKLVFSQKPPSDVHLANLMLFLKLSEPLCSDSSELQSSVEEYPCHSPVSCQAHHSVFIFFRVLGGRLSLKPSPILLVIIWVVVSIPTMDLMRFPGIVIPVLNSGLYFAESVSADSKMEGLEVLILEHDIV